MSLILKNRVQVTSTSTGTGLFALGSASAGYQSFNAISPTSNAWNISKAEYSGISFSVAAQETAPGGIFFKPDGTKMYIVGTTGDDINEYDLSIPWLISSASYLQVFSVSAQDTAPGDLFFKPDGLKMYVVGNTNDSVYEYDLSSAWNISTASFLQSFSVATEEASPQGLFFKPDGTKMYIVGTVGDDVNEYNLSSAWNISTASFLQSFSTATQESASSSIFFKPDGLKMYILGSNGDALYEYTLSSAWNVSTASYLQNFSVVSQEGSAEGLFFNADGTQFWIVGSGVDAIFSYYIGANDTYYAITGGTNWEVGIGTVLSGTELVRNRVLGSSNSGALVNWSAGSKTVRCVYPAAATAGGVPYGDDSAVGTDLSGWQAFSTALNNGVVGGQTFGNNNTNGVVSTYSLAATSITYGYVGGVLAPNGDIHFVSVPAFRGQKVNYLSGVVSTYSLVYTDSQHGYYGGVLAPNGDIHFIPALGTPVGQKINASGVVSTYSLAYTTTNAYAGGVLAPNGDVNFIPYSGRVGQKISAAGVVSTYSLVYTTTTAYFGGVLAPNGDIHFVPYSAVRGQKISAAGVVSTYSLVYTAPGYAGGVLATNGDIHFIPLVANRGQKISSAGVVSTYSLIYTTTNAYLGGVLAPNGDIHFIPYSAVVGQKISSTGVVSTYSLVYTAASANAGGVLAPDGTVYFVPYFGVRGQKISTNPGAPLGPGICLSPFLNKL